jgi:hypothetical protein
MVPTLFLRNRENDLFLGDEYDGLRKLVVEEPDATYFIIIRIKV